MPIIFKRISSEDDEQVKNIITIVLEKLENEDFFIPISEDELKDIYNKKVCIFMVLMMKTNWLQWLN